jgi:hypothetical protein
MSQFSFMERMRWCVLEIGVLRLLGGLTFNCRWSGERPGEGRRNSSACVFLDIITSILQALFAMHRGGLSESI